MNAKYLSACLFVRNIRASRKFYEEVLEQKVETDNGLFIRFADGLSIWQVNHALRSIYEKKAGCDMPSQEVKQFELNFETDDLDGIYKRIAESGVEFIHAIHEQPWGQRVFRLYDPDGHIVEFAEPIDKVMIRLFGEGMAIEEISKKTSTPVFTVEDTLLRHGIK
ncbi:MAG TPA: VOC family protein [Ruminiclostridium sp.]|nr:VOC family protein [Ruminiclostridium sp.]